MTAFSGFSSSDDAFEEFEFDLRRRSSSSRCSLCFFFSGSSSGVQSVAMCSVILLWVWVRRDIHEHRGLRETTGRVAMRFSYFDH